MHINIKRRRQPGQLSSLSGAQLGTRAALNAHVGVGWVCVRAWIYARLVPIQRSSCRHAGVQTHKTKHIGWPPEL